MRDYLSNIRNFIFEKKAGAALIVLLFAAISIFGVNQYRYGWADQAITIPFLKSAVNPELYPQDFLLAEKPYYYTFLWVVLGKAIAAVPVAIPTAFFAFYSLIIVFTFYAFYRISMILFADRLAAFFALFLILFGSTTLGGAGLIDDMLLTKVAALPFLLFSLAFWLEKKYVLAFFLQGVGFLIHPLTAFYTIVPLVIIAMLNYKTITIRRLILGLAVLLIASGPLLAWKALYSPPLLSLFHADLKWIELLRLRSAHHIFPFTWGIPLILKTFLALIIFIVSCKHKPADSSKHKFFTQFTWFLVILGAAGVLFTEVYPLPFALNLQLLRGFQFIVIFAVIYFANFFIQESRQNQSFHDNLLVLFGSVAFLFDTRKWEVAYVSFLVYLTVILIFLFLRRIKQRDVNAVRNAFAENFVLLCLLLSIGVALAGLYVQKGFSIKNAQGAEWLAAQRWAKDNTDRGALFIVPPQIEGFRVESERPIYGDWKDGTLMNFNPAFAYEWMRRMEKLGYKKGAVLKDGYNGLLENSFASIANEEALNGRTAVYIVRENGVPKLKFPTVFTNSGFVVYKVEP